MTPFNVNLIAYTSLVLQSLLSEEEICRPRRDRRDGAERSDQAGYGGPGGLEFVFHPLLYQDTSSNIRRTSRLIRLPSCRM